jgi:hypothetical protein
MSVFKSFRGRYLALLASATTMLTACSPSATSDDPRNRQGVAGDVTWRVVQDGDGQAAFLSRPGAAPDLVLWCRANGLLTLRAHIFEDPAPQPDLIMSTPGGTIAFDNVRRQGGVRAGDRKLVEGVVTLSDAKLPAILSGAADITVTSGADSYKAKNSDPNNALSAFSAACVAASSNEKEKP